MAQSITLPIKVLIENLLTVLLDMKGQLSSLKVDSSSYKKLSAIVSDIEKKILSLQVASSRPIVDAKLFTEMERSISKLEDDLTKISLEAGKIKFGDISLNPTQQGELLAFLKLIQDIDAALKQMKDSTKSVFLASDIGKAWAEAHPEAITQSLALITNAINREVQKLKEALDLARQAYLDYLGDTGARTNLNRFMKSGHALTPESMGADKYNEIFNKNGDFKSGGRGILLQWLEELFHLDPEVVLQLTADSGKKVRDAFEKSTDVDSILRGERKRVADIARERSAETNGGATLRLAVKDQEATFNGSTAVQDLMVKANQEVELSCTSLQTRLETAKDGFESWKTGVVSSVQTSDGFTGACLRMGGAVLQIGGVLEEGKSKFESLDLAVSKLLGMSNFINRYVGAYAIIRRVTTAIKNAFNNIKELDKAITSIAVVTNMSQADLWGKIGEYTLMAQEYGVTTKDVYAVSQIFYQQGLLTSQVMSMSTESLKMAKIAGIDYSTAANAMTVAVRAFKIEMSEAQQVTDTYSALAAKFAVSSSEIANAMEKTASSAASVGMSLQSTSAFISVMTQTTRESAQNIGSALKSIISRYGEMKASPEKLLDVDGEEVAFNKVDTALSSIGISIKDASGQFRDFDDVIMELALKWDSLDNNTQRYIATIMAGNRQQSRFIALVSNYDELSRAMDTANNSENASIVLVAKTMDSLESKANLVKNAFSQLYLDLHFEDALKGAYDWITRILKTIGKLGALKGILPTLTNLFGFGAGTKSLFKLGAELLLARKYKVNTSEAESDIKRVRDEASRDITSKYRIETDISQLKAALTQIQNEAMLTLQNLSQLILSANPLLASKGITNTDIMNAAVNALKAGLLRTEEDRALFMNQYGIKANTDLGAAIDKLLLDLQRLGTLAELVGNSLKTLETATLGAATSEELAKGAVDLKAQAERSASISLEQSKYSKGEEITASNELAQAKELEALGVYRVIDANTGEEIAGKLLVLTKDLEGNAIYQLINSKTGEIEATYSATRATQGEKNARETNTGEINKNSNAFRNNTSRQGLGGPAGGGTPTKAGMSWKNNSWGEGNAMKIAGVASSLARMIGTAVTAAGAAHEDKSTDNVETSKILTGVGNGLSMAGTGASMGMAFGPWGALIGAVGGFLIGGLGAIIDGLHMDLEEKLALQKEEAKKAQDEALKKSAKVTGFDSSLDNLKKLRSAMYNSSEDMLSYIDAMNTLAGQYPSLISAYDNAGNAIIDLSAAELMLAQIRTESSLAAAEAAEKERDARETTKKILEENVLNKLNEIVNDTDSAMDNAGRLKEEITYDGEHRVIALNDYNSTYLNTGIGALNADLNDDEFVAEIRLSQAASAILDKYTLNGTLMNTYEWDIKDILDMADAIALTNMDQYSVALGDTYSTWVDVARGSIENADEFNFREGYDSELEAIEKTVKSHATELGIDPANKDIKDKTPYLDALLGLEDGEVINYDRLLQVLKKLQDKVGNYEHSVDILDLTVTRTNALAELDSLLNNKVNAKTDSITYDTLEKISTSNVATSLIMRGMDSLALTEYGAEDAASLQATNDTAFDEIKLEATLVVVDYLTSLSETLLDNFISVMSSLDLYSSADNVLDALHIDKNDPANAALVKDIQEQFVAANQTNRDRILKTIYAYEDGKLLAHMVNKDMKGLEKIGWYDDARYKADKNGEHGGEANYALDIAHAIGHGGKIISEYSNFFTDQLLSINEMAENGYTEVAKGRLKVLHTMMLQLEQMDDDLMQADLFGILTSVDFSSYDSIAKALTLLEEYATEAGIDITDATKPVGALYQALGNASNDLLFNVNTMAMELTEQIGKAAKEIDSILSANKSGISFDSAIEKFNELSATADNIKSFDLVFKYDAALGQYVYTVDGLLSAIAAKEEELATQADLLSETAKIYTELITTKNGDKFEADLRLTKLGKDAFTNAEKLYDSILGTGIGSKPEDTKLRSAYETLAADYIAEVGEGNGNARGFVEYIEKRAKENNELASAALLLSEEYKKNKKNYYYLNIDWSKLALGTDFSGTNTMMMESLAQELGMGTFNKSGIFEWSNGLVKTLNEVLDEYLDKNYGDNDQAKLAAKVAIEGLNKQQKSQSISTAITEVLAGAGAALSEGSAEILAVSGQLDGLVDESGVIDAEADCILAALDFFNSMRDSFTTVGEKNKAYAEIINASFKENLAAQTLMSSGNKLDFSTIESTFTDLGLDLSLYWDAEKKEWYAANTLTGVHLENGKSVFEYATGGLNEFLETDIFGKITITDWDKYIQWIADLRGKDIEDFKSSPEYEKYQRLYIDSLISDQDAEDVGKLATQALSTLASAKVGLRVNVDALKNSGLSQEIIDKLDKDNDGIFDVVSEVERDNIIMAMDAASILDKEYKRQILEALKAITKKRNKFAGLKGIAAERVGDDAAKAFVESFGIEDATEEIIDSQMRLRGYVYDSFTNEWIATTDTISHLKNRLQMLSTTRDGQDHTQEIKELEATIRNLEETLNGKKRYDSVSDILTNYTNVTNEQIAAFETQFKNIDLDSMITEDEITGEKRIDVTKLRNALKTIPEYKDKIDELFGDLFSLIADDYLSTIDNAVSLVSQGTSNQTEMQKFIKNAKALGINNADKAFMFDRVLGAWTLSPAMLQEYVTKLAEEMVNAGLMTRMEMNRYIKTHVTESLANEIDVSGFLTAENLEVGSQAYDEIFRTLANYIATISDDLIKVAVEKLDAAYGNGHFIEEELIEGESSIQDYRNELTKGYIALLKEGGEGAVKVMETIMQAQGKEMSSSDVESAYLSEVSLLENAFEQLAYGKGSLISGKAKELIAGLTSAGYEIQELDANNAVITQIGDISAAYEAYYKALLKTGEATLAALNEAKAKVYETKDGRATEQVAIDLLDDAWGMTYTEFGETLANLGIEMTDSLMQTLENNKIIESIGGNLMRIKDFNFLADSLGWDYDSEAYLGALTAYNKKESGWTKEKRQTMVDELKALSEARNGEKIDLTLFIHTITKSQETEADEIDALLDDTKSNTSGKITKLRKAIQAGKIRKNTLTNEYEATEDATEEDRKVLKDFKARVQKALKKRKRNNEAILELQLEQYNVSLENGLLTINEGANIIGLAQALLALAQGAGDELADAMSELADTVKEVIQSYVEAIKKGISGGLTSVEAEDLNLKALSLGFPKVTFKETAEGLKLSLESAIGLYYAIKAVDKLLATLVFEDLNNSLKESNEHYKSITSIMEYMTELQAKLAASDEDVSDVRKKLYEEELRLAQEIVAVRSTSEDESYNFMSNKIPGALNNPINYYENWAQAFLKIRDGLKLTATTTGENGKKITHKGLIDYQDWYNIVTEMNNLATEAAPIILSDAIKLDGSAEAAAELILKGAEALTVDSNGNVKVAFGDIADLGIDFKTGAQDMANGIDAGLKSFALSQVNMLDGLIRILEAVVAFELLGDIDVDGMGIDLNDLFVLEFEVDENSSSLAIVDFEEGYKHWQASIAKKIEEYNKDPEHKKNKDLVEALRSIKLTLNGEDFSLEQMIQWDVSKFKDDPGLAKAYTALVNAMVLAAKSGDYDLDNIAASVLKELAAAGVFDLAISIDVGDTTLLFTGTTHVEINWADENTQDLMSRIADSTEEGKKTARKMITEALRKWITGESLGDAELNYILYLNKKVTFKDGGTDIESITIGDLTYTNIDTNDTGAYLGAAALEAANYGDEVLKYLKNNKLSGKEVVIEYEFDNHTKMNIKGSSAGVQFEGQDGEWYDTQEKALEADFKLYQEDIEAGGERLAKWGQKQYGTQEEFNWGEHEIRATVTPKVTIDNKDIDVTTASDARTNLLDALLKVTNNDLVPDGTGNYILNAGDAKIKLAAKDVEIDGEKDLQKAIAAVKTQLLGEDLGLQENITKGILAAVKDGIKLEVSGDAETNLTAILDKLQEVTDNSPYEAAVNIDTATAANKVQTLLTQWDNWIPKAKRVLVTGNIPLMTSATGNIGLANARGTLMGELGPELVVSQGRYFVVGQNGPEMVDLADDAIVFNHLLTKSLLEKGMSNTRGQVVTNERNAVSFATGNVNGGPAMASASAALAALKQLRAQWASLAELSAKDLAGKGSGGGGGGNKAFLKDLERWYNWLQRIALIEKDINYLESQRGRISSEWRSNGYDYYNSLKKSLDLLKELLSILNDLTKSQEAYFNKRRAELNSDLNPFNSLYWFDESGQLKYKNGKFEELSNMVGSDKYNKPNMSVEKLYEYITKTLGISEEYFKYDNSGNEIEKDDYAAKVLKFWDQIDTDKEEMQSLHDSVEDGYKQLEDLLKAQNEILKEMRDNLMDLEQKVYDAVVDIRERAIDKLEETKDAILDSNDKFIDGLTKALEKERTMYENAENRLDLDKLRNLRDILVRSGGSAAEIASLNEEIENKERDLYFDAQQEEIDKILEASDKLIAKLDAEISLQTLILDYQKKYGLLWSEVTEIMSKSPKEIADFIALNDSDYWNKSPVSSTDAMNLLLFSSELWAGYRDDAIVTKNNVELIAKKITETNEDDSSKETTDDGSGSDDSGKSDNTNPTNNLPSTSTEELKTWDVYDEKGFKTNYTVKAKNQADALAIAKEKYGSYYSVSPQRTIQGYSYNGKNYKTEKEANDARNALIKTLEGLLNNNAIPTDAKEKIRDELTKAKAKNVMPYYSQGGYDYNTGLAMLHGTKMHPEAILNASQTKILRENILGNKPNSLVNLLSSYNDAYKGLSSGTYDSISNNSTATQIDKAEVNLYVDLLANDYDSRLAANTIMDEMLRIASKTKANNSVRR